MKIFYLTLSRLVELVYSTMITPPSPSFVSAGADTDERMVLISTIFFLLHEISGVPIIFDKKPQRGNTADGQCTLTLKLGRGTSEFLEDCHTLGELIKVYHNTFNVTVSV